MAKSRGDTKPGTHSFTLVAENRYSKQWGGVAIKIDDVTSVPFFSGTKFGPTNSITLKDGFYYSFRILDPGQVAVMKTSAPPVSVNRSGQTPTAPGPNDSIIVSITTSEPKSPEERIYLRWSTDFFITSHLVAAAGSGVDYSATIPAQSAGTAVQYSIITSTVDLSTFVSSGIIDALTLASTGSFHYFTNP